MCYWETARRLSQWLEFWILFTWGVKGHFYVASTVQWKKHKLGHTTLVSIKNSALLLFKQISFFKHSVGRLEQSQEGIFCAQLTDLGQSSALTKDSKHTGVFTKESSQAQLWPLLSVWVQPVQAPPISTATARRKTAGNCTGSGQAPDQPHCTASPLLPKRLVGS